MKNLKFEQKIKMEEEKQKDLKGKEVECQAELRVRDEYSVLLYENIDILVLRGIMEESSKKIMWKFWCFQVKHLNDHKEHGCWGPYVD